MAGRRLGVTLKPGSCALALACLLAYLSASLVCLLEDLLDCLDACSPN